MNLTKYQKQAIVRTIIDDLPKLPEREEMQRVVQAEIVDAMSKTCRKLYDECPTALMTTHIWFYDYDITFQTGDVQGERFQAIAKKWTELHEARRELGRKLSIELQNIRTTKQFAARFPKLAGYLPGEKEATSNLPATNRIDEILTLLGWTKKH